MIRQVKPPALFSVDLSNVPAASCSIIMVSSPLLLHRRCLSSLSLLLLLLFSSYCFLFSLSLLRSAIPSTERSLPRSPPRSQISKSESLPPSLSLFQSSSPSNFSASLLRCSAVASCRGSALGNEDNEDRF